MSRKLWILALGALLVVAAAALWGRRGPAAPDYRMAVLQRGSVTEVVSATGALEAVTTVQVGTQVSGIIAEIHADFNDEVKAGAVIARLDTRLLDAAVEDARTTVERRQAELRQAERAAERVGRLHEEGIVQRVELETSSLALEVARSQLETARVALARAEDDRGYATITAPIDGTVVARLVDVGQTVAASLSAPELFLIAADLAQMQILAAVDESDIGRIQPGQKARFTVQAYADDVFEAAVRQVRLQSTMVDNVVSYTAVLEVDNRDGRLLPGMTATVDFVIAEAEDVLLVPNAALRFRPDPGRIASPASEAAGGQPDAATGTVRNGGPGRGRGEARQSGSGRMRTVLWRLLPDGRLSALPVRVGISDGVHTEVAGDDLAAGLEVVLGTSGVGTPDAGSGSPFGGGASGGGRGGGGGPRRMPAVL